MANFPRIIFILGPTSSGKTAVALELARLLNGEIISCDSMQVYRDMDILTHASDARLSRIIPPEEEYDAARFAHDAEVIIKEILGKGKVPIIAGGTGLYVKALLDGIFPSPAKSENIRLRLNKEAEDKGVGYLYKKLAECDPETAKKLHPNDIRRVIRALEVHELTGSTIHEKKKEAKGIRDMYECRIFGMKLPRDVLYGRIDRSVEEMFRGDIISEVRKLLSRKLGLTAEKALGVKEVSAYLDGELGLDEAKELLKKNTRNYAKRQLTWFRADKNIEWIDAGTDPASVAEEIFAKLGPFDFAQGQS